jgi:hypothetical protein
VPPAPDQASSLAPRKAARAGVGAANCLRIEMRAERLRGFAQHRQRIGAQQRAAPARVAAQPGLECLIPPPDSGPRSSLAIQSAAFSSMDRLVSRSAVKRGNLHFRFP